MAHCPKCGKDLPDDAVRCTGCGSDVAPAGTAQPVSGALSRKARPQAFPIIPAVIAVLIFAIVFSWAYYVEHEKGEKRKQAEEARSKELSVPVIGQGGVSVRIVAECSKDEFLERYKVQKVVRDGEVLVVQLAATEACGLLRAVQPRADIAGNTVTLGWFWKMENDAPLAACLCTRHLEFRIPGVPPGDPQIAIVENVPLIR